MWSCLMFLLDSYIYLVTVYRSFSPSRLEFYNLMACLEKNFCPPLRKTDSKQRIPFFPFKCYEQYSFLIDSQHIML